jgi:hypothetical protein
MLHFRRVEVLHRQRIKKQKIKHKAQRKKKCSFLFFIFVVVGSPEVGIGSRIDPCKSSVLLVGCCGYLFFFSLLSSESSRDNPLSLASYPSPPTLDRVVTIFLL